VRVIDITVPLRERMPTYDSEPGPTLEFTRHLSEGASSTVSVLSLGSHTGTHVDAPAHFVEGRETIDAIPADVLVGEAFVVEHAGDGHVTAADLEGLGVPDDCERLLVKTGNGALWEDDAFHSDFIALAPDAAEWLLSRGVRLVGIDYLSIEQYHASPHAVHGGLLGAGVVVLEGVDLREVEPGPYLLVCAPLKVVGAEGAPARAFLVADWAD
jgi:arylformamidase